MRVNTDKLPVFAEFDEVPYVVYEDSERGPVAINDFATESGLLPEILFEGEAISRERFVELAGERQSDKYEEVLDFYDSQSE